MKTLDQLEAIANAATPGEWKYVNGEVVKEESRDDGLFSLLLASEGGDGEWKYDGRFIAAFNPLTAKAFIADMRKMREALEIVRDAAHSDGCGGLCWSDDAAYEAFDNAREALAGLEIK